MTDEEKWNQFQERQDRVDQLFEELQKDLELEKTEAMKCLVDWVYVNSDVDFLSLAVERDECSSDYGNELPEFVCAAIKAWLKPKGGKLSTDDTFKALDAIICAYRYREE